MKKRLMIAAGLMISMLFLPGYFNYNPGDKPTDTFPEVEGEKPLIFPIPGDVRIDKGNFIIDKNAFIMIPEKAGKSDDFLARLLLSELVDKYEQYIGIKARSAFSDNDRFI